MVLNYIGFMVHFINHSHVYPFFRGAHAPMKMTINVSQNQSICLVRLYFVFCRKKIARSTQQKIILQNFSVKSFLLPKLLLLTFVTLDLGGTFYRERIIVHICWHFGNLKKTYLGNLRLPKFGCRCLNL